MDESILGQSRTHLGLETLFDNQASGQRKHQIAGLFDAACPLQIAGTCYVHLPLQGQTRTSSRRGGNGIESFSLMKCKCCKGHLVTSNCFNTVSTFFDDEQRDDSLKIA